jgi:phosphoglycerate kinase
MGIIEIDAFARGTEEIALHISQLKATTIAGGGETISVIDKLKIGNKFTFVSTAGGAALEFLEGKELPGLKALEDSEKKFEQ